MMAYIDPTAGGMALQVIFGGIAAFFVFFWSRIKGFFKKAPVPPPPAAAQPGDPAPKP
jgi:hypothetical protein